MTVLAGSGGLAGRLRPMMALLSCALVASACTPRGADGSPGSSASPADPFGRIAVGPKEPLQLGILLGLSGTDPSVGLAALRGVQLALDYLDGTFDGTPGPLMDHTINLEIEDSRCSADGSRVGAQELANDARVVGVIGMSCPNSAVGGADRILSDRGVLLISPANTEPRLTAAGTHQPFFLRTAYNAALDGVVMADLARGPRDAQTAAVIRDGGEGSLALARAFSTRFEAKGGTVTTSAGGGADGGGIGQTLDGIGRNEPGFLFVPGSDPSCAAIARQAQDVQGLSGTAFGSSSACEGSFRVTAPDDPGGAYLSRPDVASIEGGEFYQLQFMPTFEDQFGTGSVPVVSAYAFDAANILFDAMQVSATRSDDGSLVFRRSVLRDAIFATDSYEGLTGPLTCTPLGDCAAPVRFAVYPAADLPAQGQDDPTSKSVFTEVLSTGDLIA